MTVNPLTWEKVAHFFRLIYELRKSEWNCVAPAHDTLPSAALESVVDEWCARMARDVERPLDAPAIVRPWILARLVSASADAGIHAEVADQPCPPAMTPQVVEQYLIAEWHHALRNRWCLML